MFYVGLYSKTYTNFINHWPECIDIWHGTSLGQEDSGLFK